MIDLKKKMLNQRGSAIMISLLVLMVLGILLTAASPMIINELKFETINANTVGAQFAAEAGAKVAIEALYAGNSDWTWLAKNQNLVTNNSTKTYNVTISPTISGAPVPGTAYTITSVGTVNNVSKQVVVKATTGSTIFTNSSFAAGSITMNGGTINGNVATNGSLTMNSGSSVAGNATYSTGSPPPSSAVSGTVKQTSNSGSLNVSSFMQTIPAVPTFTKSGTDINTKPSGALAGGSYYSNSSVDLNRINYTIASGNSVLIYVVGNLQMDRSSSIVGGNITIYATGNIVMNSGTSVQAGNNGSVSLYAGGTMQLNSASITGQTIILQSGSDMTLNSGTSIQQATSGGSVSIYSGGNFQMNGASIAADAVTMISNGTYTLNSSTTINPTLPNSITKIYTNGATQVNGANIGGTGLIVSASPNTVYLNSNTTTSTTVLIAQGNVQVNGAFTGGIYSNGAITVNSGSTVTYDPTAAGKLGLNTSSSTSTPFSINSWGKQ